MRYLKKFATEAEMGMSERPNVCLAEDTGNVFYNYLKGVFIQHIDGTLYTTEEWTAGGFTNDLANGVAVIDPAASFVIARGFASTGIAWSSDTSNVIEGIITTTDSATAKTDYAGAANTELMLAAGTSGAAHVCANFTFPNGAKGYLPAAGEFTIAANNKTAVNAALSLVGGNQITGFYQWTSTQVRDSQAWCMYGEGYLTNYGKSRTQYVRPFTSL